MTLFLLAFTASALWQFWPNAWTRWQRQNRRYLGVSFAVSHAIHLAAILMLGQVAPAELAREADIVTVIFGGLAYLFIAAMTLTSFDRTAAAIGPRAWKILHTVGLVLHLADLREQLCVPSRDGHGVLAHGGHRCRRAGAAHCRGSR